MFVPLKIWNSTRNEKKLEEQERLLVEARLAALTSQINPHFLFNTLNSVSSLIRTDPNQARVMVVQLLQSPAPPAAQARELQHVARRIEFH